jgi:metacaspase-1
MTKKALLVGLNRYPDPENTLRGCLNDVRQIHAMLLEHRGFREDGSIVTLTDAEATTGNIVERLHWLVDGAAPGDVLVFHYSGHGSQVEDLHGDELDDGLDEIICPYDLDWNDPFTDDDLHDILKGLPAGANLTVVLDCCHSGTGLRMVAPPNQQPRCIASRSPRFGMSARQVRRFGARASQRGAVLIAGCRSDQVSADALIEGSYHGALTFYLCQALEELGHRGSYRQLVRRTRKLLTDNGYSQIPQLEGPQALLDQEIFSAPLTTLA